MQHAVEEACGSRSMQLKRHAVEEACSMQLRRHEVEEACS